MRYELKTHTNKLFNLNELWNGFDLTNQIVFGLIEWLIINQW